MWLPVALIVVMLVLAVLMCLQERKKRKVNFWIALFICILLTPVLGYFIISSFALRNPRGCAWCGNVDNEAAFCGICGKDVNGNTAVSTVNN